MIPTAIVNSATGALLQASHLLLIALFNAALRVPVRTPLWLYALLLTPFMVAAARYPAEQGPEQTLVPATMSLALAAMFGIVVHARQDHLASLVERDQQARLATTSPSSPASRTAGAARRPNPRNAPRKPSTFIATTSRQALTEREREILTVIGMGWTNTEIAERLHLAESTVKTHVGRVLAKTGSRDRIQAVILAYERGW
ncbi:hypothetical protein BN159_4744 [Streptomyces davaonensis JCM 4913]|uniref:HTH luxR-type domain-containing protein n=1 Tax=Streptomyces davaonensis (strain DSM 101723 / JCM 4913 / KCC S-0913 / 768) TaxID=1214101 RepID=K4R6X7_STRDJ|nr:response regulator transcription factor [Streptomyces davaonensis]CCK29123.1 hypothetical protein BN159_4744 [Streptomyces davaonensis JCM 4913]